MTTKEKKQTEQNSVLELNDKNEKDEYFIDDRKVVVCVDSDGVKYLSDRFHKTDDDKLYTREQYTAKFRYQQRQILEKYNELVLNQDELIANLCKHSEIKYEQEIAKADITATQDSEIKKAVNHYLSVEKLTEPQIVDKMRKAKLSDEIIKQYFPNSFKSKKALAF